ncbi:MAG: transglycosylase SLT domain-containing protein [Emcibacter sp.]|nr:transglycosylase SLT domain-containing protein [Emcibacter sp.]
MRKTGFILAAVTILLSGCSTSPPRNIDDGCAIFKEKSGWYKAMLRSQKKYGTPIHVQLAIIHQESSFKHNAKTERTHIFWVIPWGRKSTAYGYAQVKDGTWDWYKQKTGNRGADRDNFADATDFIGWYTDVSQKTLGISKWDAENQYLAYHEGHGGFKRKNYRKKPWLMKVAKKVQRNSLKYAAQLKKCESSLDRGFWFWPF